jgi:hypothetical protein
MPTCGIPRKLYDYQPKGRRVKLDHEKDGRINTANPRSGSHMMIMTIRNGTHHINIRNGIITD